MPYNYEFIKNFAGFIKSKFKTELNYSLELSKYINGHDTEIDSDTDKYFNNVNDYDEIYFEYLIKYVDTLDYEKYHELEREKIIEYALYLLGKKLA